MPRPLVFAMLGAVVPAAGCFFVLPGVSHAPGAPVPAGDEVIAFAVHATRWQHGTAPIPHEVHTLRRVELRDGEARAQVRPYLARHYFFTGRSEYVLTKLYRRGYKTVTLDADREPGPVVWEPADGVEAHADAVRELLYKTRPGGVREHAAELAPGSSDPRHREALLFAAGEFDRVSRLKWNDPESPEKCRAEAEKVRARAAE